MEGAYPQVPITYEDLAVRFSEEEWGILQEWQKDLYAEVMRDNYNLLHSLGYENCKPDLIIALEKWRKRKHGRHKASTQRSVRALQVPLAKRTLLGMKSRGGTRCDLAVLHRQILALCRSSVEAKKERSLVMKSLQDLRDEQKVIQMSIEKSHQDILGTLEKLSQDLFPYRTPIDYSLLNTPEIIMDMPPSCEEQENFPFPLHGQPSVLAYTPVTKERECTSPLGAQCMVVSPHNTEVLEVPPLQTTTPTSPDIQIMTSSNQTTAETVSPKIQVMMSSSSSPSKIIMPTLASAFPLGSRTTSDFSSRSDVNLWSTSPEKPKGPSKIRHDLVPKNFKPTKKRKQNLQFSINKTLKISTTTISTPDKPHEIKGLVNANKVIVDSRHAKAENKISKLPLGEKPPRKKMGGIENIQVLSRKKTDETPEVQSLSMDEPAAVQGLSRKKMDEPAAVQGLSRKKMDEPPAVQGSSRKKMNEPLAVLGLSRKKMDEPAAVQGLSRKKMDEPLAVLGLSRKKMDEPPAVLGLSRKKMDEPATVQGLSRKKMDELAAAQGLSRKKMDEPPAVQGLSRKKMDEPAAAQGLSGKKVDEPAAVQGLSGKKMDRQPAFPNLASEKLHKPAGIQSLSRKRIDDPPVIQDPHRKKMENTPLMQDPSRKKIGETSINQGQNHRIMGNHPLNQNLSKNRMENPPVIQEPHSDRFLFLAKGLSSNSTSHPCPPSIALPQVSLISAASNYSPPPKMPKLDASLECYIRKPCLPDIEMCQVSNERIDKLYGASQGSLLRFAGLVFRALVPLSTYLQWCHMANYSGTHQKKAIPQNVKNKLLSYMGQYFYILGSTEKQQIRDGVNNQLRNPRKTDFHPGVS